MVSLQSVEAEAAITTALPPPDPPVFQSQRMSRRLGFRSLLYSNGSRRCSHLETLREGSAHGAVGRWQGTRTAEGAWEEEGVAVAGERSDSSDSP